MLYNHHHCPSPELFHIPDSRCDPLTIASCLSSPQPDSHFLSPQIWPLQVPCVSGILLYLSLWVLLIFLSIICSRFIQAEACVRNSFLFTAEKFHCMGIQHSLFFFFHLRFLKVQDVPGTKLGHQASRMKSLSSFLQQVHRYWVKSSEDGIGMVLLGHLITQQTWPGCL